MVKIEELTRQQKQDICIAYLASGNSVHDLCIQIIECLGGTDVYSGAVETYFDDLVKDLKEARETADPGDFDTTAEEEVNSLLKTAEGHEYEYNTICWG